MGRGSRPALRGCFTRACSAEGEREFAKCCANLPAVAGDQLDRRWRKFCLFGFFFSRCCCTFVVVSWKKTFRLYVVLNLKAEAFFVCVSTVEESFVTFVLYLVLEVTLCPVLNEMERLCCLWPAVSKDEHGAEQWQ